MHSSESGRSSAHDVPDLPPGTPIGQKQPTRTALPVVPLAVVSRRRNWRDCFDEDKTFDKRMHNQSYVDRLSENLRTADAEGASKESFGGTDNKVNENEDCVEDSGRSRPTWQLPTNLGYEEDGVQGDYEEVETRPEDPCYTSVFMNGSLHIGGAGVSEAYDGQFDDVKRFCGHLNIHDLEGNHAVEPNILVHEQSEDGRCRENFSLMNSRQFLGAFKRAVSYFPGYK